MNDKIKKIAIVGVGFMGGSLALALKKNIPGVRVWGFARSLESFKKLSRLHILDKVERNLGELIVESDIVVLALPIFGIVEYFKKINPYLKKGATVIDLGSSKQLVESSAKRYLSKEVSFVGCHPLCGSEKSGAQYSNPALYQNAVCIITGTPRRDARRRIERLWKAIGAKIVSMSGKEHDRILSMYSHLPHVISFALTHSAPLDHKLVLPASFKDVTRVSHSPAAVWADILVSNRRFIIKDAQRLIDTIKTFQRYLALGSTKRLSHFIKKINNKHSKFFKLSS